MSSPMIRNRAGPKLNPWVTLEQSEGTSKADKELPIAKVAREQIHHG